MTTRPVEDEALLRATSPSLAQGSCVQQEEKEEAQSKRKRTSVVWKCFDEVIIEGKTWIKCKYCSSFKYQKVDTGPTTQLLRHMKSCGGKPKEKGQTQLGAITKIPTEGEVLQMSDLTTYKYDPQIVRKLLCVLIIVDERTFRCMESKIFNLFCKALNPKYPGFTRKTIKRDCIKMYEEERAVLKRKFERIETICFTSDTWTSNQCKSYLSFTAHWLDDDWKLQKRIVNFKYFPPPHTGYAMSELITDLIIDWGLENKFFTLTLDNAASNDNMAKLLHGSFPSNPKFSIRCNVFHVRCAAHILNLIVQVGMGHIKEMIENVCESIKYIKGSSARLKQFEICLANVGVENKKGLDLDVSTRWNSTYLMLKAARDVKPAFNHLMGVDANYIWCPSELDWNNYEDIEELLEVFYRATLSFSATKYPTSNLFFWGVSRVRRVLDKFSSHKSLIIREMIVVMNDKFDKYWKENSLVLTMACILDPRYKLYMVKFMYEKLYPIQTDFDKKMKVVNDALRSVFNFYENRVRDCNHDYFPQSESGSRMLTDDEEFELYVESRSEGREKRSDLDAYLDEERLKAAPTTFDVLDYWKMASLKYKALGEMTRDILAIPVSTVASESTFNTARWVVSDYRSSLAPTTIEALICTRSWLCPRYATDHEEEVRGVDDEKEDKEEDNGLNVNASGEGVN